MAKQVFDNKDLVSLIYSFGPGHREQMKQVYDSFKTSTKCLLSPVPNEMKHHPNLDKFIEFFVLKRCRCCSRHSHGKPNIYMEHGEVVFEVKRYQERVPEGNIKECDCSCRKDCRNLLWELAYEQPVVTTYPSLQLSLVTLTRR